MDERVLERMVTRSYTTVRNLRALALSAAGIFIAALIWVSFQPMFRPITAELHVALLFLTLSVGSIIWAPLISPLVHSCLSQRAGEEEASIVSLLRSQYKQMGFLSSQSAMVSLIQFFLVLFIGLWKGIEAIPVVGAALFLLLSWLPALLSGLSALIFLSHLLSLFAARISLVNTSSDFTITKPWAFWPHELFSDWAIRIKLVLVGLFPVCLFFVATFVWPIPSFEGALSALAMVFRAAAFSVLAAPLFLFAIHMAIESDRYSQWLSARRVG